MLMSLLAVTLLAAPLSADTTIRFGSVTRDLTGDTIPEVIAHEMTPPNSTRGRMIWDQMQTAGITIFEFSPGGDSVMSIGWSASDKRFYNLVECC